MGTTGGGWGVRRQGYGCEERRVQLSGQHLGSCSLRCQPGFLLLPRCCSYCSVECQAADWRARHHADCGALRGLSALLGAAADKEQQQVGGRGVAHGAVA